ncbi:hypothetical protein [Polynucleobacter sp. AP-Titi-500A-B4]|uniref:hypothetical protein n=1 Tax=Polynucleobacter sp. AP-Titi-500A-B4 TaxID=2576923 RepID=UPI001BFE5A3A|nr:hypothetical protein [Polynucleobacter sp. AP-Titi-500A-B4]QWE12830.1 hypothetical protein FD968_01765 [Polynucleobacter sp. AP-Titi-500A-B4]
MSNNNMTKNAIVVLAIGKKYEEILRSQKPQLEAYAARCNANLEIRTEPPDELNRGHLFTQKLLLPSLYIQYEWIAFLDLDIVISSIAPSIFDSIHPNKAFGAVIDQRKSRCFRMANKYWHRQERLNQTAVDLFYSEKGFKPHPKVKATINGGVWLCKPIEIAHIFKKFYEESVRNNQADYIYEEIPMSYLAHTNDQFFPLNPRFNKQVIYEIFKFGAPMYWICRIQKKINKRLEKYLGLGENYFISSCYRKFITQLLGKNYILHFSGNFPIPKNSKNTISKSSMSD